jgi:hypothetical protein
MIDDPDRWAVGYAEAGAANVTFHIEAAADPVATARAVRAAGSMAGLAVDRDTPLEPHVDLLPEFDTLLIMTIKAGFGGQQFLPAMLDKVRTARRHINAGHLRCSSRSTAASPMTPSPRLRKPAPTCSSPAPPSTAPATRRGGRRTAGPGPCRHGLRRAGSRADHRRRLAAMRAALMLGETVLGQTSPNPPVGAVVLDGAVTSLARDRPGPPAASMPKWSRCAPRARPLGAERRWVTLEPCNHTGATPRASTR